VVDIGILPNASPEMIPSELIMSFWNTRCRMFNMARRQLRYTALREMWNADMNNVPYGNPLRKKAKAKSCTMKIETPRATAYVTSLSNAVSMLLNPVFHLRNTKEKVAVRYASTANAVAGFKVPGIESLIITAGSVPPPRTITAPEKKSDASPEAREISASAIGVAMMSIRHRLCSSTESGQSTDSSFVPGIY